MRNFIILVLAFGLSTCNAQVKQSSKEVNVLFIGNSLTYFYDMPQTLQKMLDENNSTIKIHQSTFPGMSLSGHLSDIIESRTQNGIRTRQKNANEVTETEQKVKERQWDVIVLQTGTVSILIPESRDFQINKAVSDIKTLVKNPACKFILFYTWPSKNTYPEKYCYSSSLIDPSIDKEECCSPILENLQQEYQLINEGYDVVAQKGDLIKTSHAKKYYEVLTKHPEINLYEDDSHPNKYGAFLNACIFYEMLAKRKPSLLKFIGDIEPEIAKSLKSIADSN